MPFLEILTRHLITRPNLLGANQASLDQLDGDWEQTLLVDGVGHGIGWSQLQMRDYAPRMTGDYIWILDDDDICIRPTLMRELESIAYVIDPDLIMMRMDHGPRGIQPDNQHWQKPPAHGHIGSSTYVVRRELWQHCAEAWSDEYHADFLFGKALFDTSPMVVWHDVIASRVQLIGLGRSEKELAA